MKCDEARLILLEADPAELRGQDSGSEGSSALARHLRSCSPCAEAAALILEADAALDAYLDPPVSEEAVEVILARLPGVTPRVAPRWRRAAWTSVALAAAVAGLLLYPTAPRPTPDLARLASAEARPLVEHTGSETVAVIETDNPDITVLWFF